MNMKKKGPCFGCDIYCLNLHNEDAVVKKCEKD